MTPELYQKLAPLFDEALTYPPDRRLGFLNRVGADSPELRAALESLLAHSEAAEQGRFLVLPDRQGQSSEAGSVPRPESPGLHPDSLLQPSPTGPHSLRRLGLRYSDFIRNLLHQRIRIAMPVGCCLFLFFLIKDVLSVGYHLSLTDSLFVVHVAATLGLLVLAVVVWILPGLSMSSLRAVEYCVLGILIVFLLEMQRDLLLKSPAWAANSDVPDLFLFVTDRISVRWFAVLVGYGLFVPNTKRRSLFVVTTLAVIPLTFEIAFSAMQGLLGLVAEPLLEMAVWLVVGSALAIVGSYKIETLGKMGFDSPKLGQYEIKRLLGRGGMGEVYLARDTLLDRLCALKVIRPERTQDGQTLLRFEREVRATARLDHGNIVMIYHHAHAEDGTFYYVMEYVQGLDLQQLVDRHGPLPPERAVHLLRQAAAALHHAHSSSLIHRDVKPSNMIVCDLPGKYDEMKLVDFGLARETDPEQAISRGDALVGTPSFMSPEQVKGKGDLDARSDIYSLGAVAYFLLVGAPPFVKDTYVDVLFAHLHHPPDPPSKKREEIPADLEAIVLRCLEKDPSQRFTSALALSEALSHCTGSTAWTREQAANWWVGKLPPEPRV